MSSTNRGAERSRQDWYPTPHWCTHRLLEAVTAAVPEVRFGSTTHWLEPCAGDGDIIAAQRSFALASGVGVGTRWTAVELRPECEGRLREVAEDVVMGDVLPYAQTRLRDVKGSRPPFDGVLTNPPFILAQPILEACLPLARVTILLLRQNYLGSESRAPFWHKHMPDLFTLPNRPSFTGQGQVDSIEYAWFLFHGLSVRRRGSIQVLATTPIAERKADPTRGRYQVALPPRPEFTKDELDPCR